MVFETSHVIWAARAPRKTYTSRGRPLDAGERDR